MLRALAACLAATCVLASARPAAAEDPGVRVLAQQLFDEAEALLNAERVAEACPKYAESYRLDPQLGVLIYLAECYEKRGQLASAWAAFRDAEGMAVVRRDPRGKYARERIEALTPRLSRLTVDVPVESREAGLTLHRNGLQLPAGTWGTPTPTDAGSYVLEAKAPGKKTWTASVVVPAEAASVTVVVPVLASESDDLLPLAPVAPVAKAPPGHGAPDSGSVSQAPAMPPHHPRTSVVALPSAPEKLADDSRPSRRITALAVGGLGVVGLGVGGILALGARSKFDDSAPLCNDAGFCTAEGAALRDNAQSKALVASVVAGVGAAAVVTGVVLWITAPGAPPARTKASWSVVPAPSGWGIGAHHAF